MGLEKSDELGEVTNYANRWKLEIDRYGFFEADTAISADTDISKIFKSCFLLHYQRYDVFYALPSFQNLNNQDL